MRLKTFHAKTMEQAMAEVRTVLGPDAIIISIDEGEGVGGVRITAALEAEQPIDPVPEQAPAPEQTPLAYEQSHPVPIESYFDQADIQAVLAHHALPYQTATRFASTVRKMDAGSLQDAFANALETLVRFNPLTHAPARPVMLIGPPGAGKTVSLAKLVAGALLHEKPVYIISVDTVKAGGVAQLDHFAGLMHQTVKTAETPSELASLMARAPDNAVVLIDTPGTTPFDMDELERLLKFVRAVNAEPVLVVPAGLEPADAEEISAIFRRMGCQRFIATRLDAARRYAGLLMAARPNFLALAAFSRSPFVADGLVSASPIELSRVLTALPDITGRDKMKKKGVS